MIYKFYAGPEDGAERDIAEMPMGAVYRIPLPASIDNFNACDLGHETRLERNEAHYQVTDVGELTFVRYV